MKQSLRSRGLDGSFTFNTAIAAIMSLLNAVDAAGVDDQAPLSARQVYRHALEMIVLLISPFAPHIAEEFGACSVIHPAY